MFEEIMSENFSNLGKESDIQVQQTQRVPNQMNTKRPTSNHILNKIGNVKGKVTILKQQEINKSHTKKKIP